MLTTTSSTTTTTTTRVSHFESDGGSENENPHGMGGFGYGIGLSIGILVLITTITLASYFCARDAERTNDDNHNNNNDNDNNDIVIKVEGEGGIDEVTLKTYPKYKYSSMVINNNKAEINNTSSCCAICLADYIGDDVVRALPECSHVFHVQCVDPWLRSHPTCPVCRTSPLSTPLADVVPLSLSAPR